MTKNTDKEIQHKVMAMNTQLRLLDSVEQVQTNPSAEESIRAAIQETLREVREILHRRGQLSSRQEALDELAKLLLAHVLSIDTGGDGIGPHLLELDQSPSAALRNFVATAMSSHIPKSLSVELNPSDFELKFRLSENKLCSELIHCFAKKLSKSVLIGVQGAGKLDILNATFGQFLVDSFKEEKELGQYLTPTEVVRMMVGLGLASLSEAELESLCSPGCSQNAGLILDPSCGVGSFLAEALRALYIRAKSNLPSDVLSSWIDQVLGHNIVGIDKSERMIRLAMSNLALFGIPAANLHLANSLLRSGPDGDLCGSLQGRVSLLLTNPPFGAEFSGPDLVGYKISGEWIPRPQKVLDSEVLYVERYINWLAPGGILVAIVPDSILTNRGVYQHLRNAIAESIDLLSVISLPTVTFSAAGTGTKTSILHLRKRQGERQARKTFFAICSDVGYEVNTRGAHRRKIPTGEGQLPSILRAATRRQSLEIGGWVRLPQNVQRWDAGYHAGLPRTVQRRLEAQLPGDVLLSQVSSISRERVDPRRFSEEKFKYVEISDVDADSCTVGYKWVLCSEAPSRARKLIRSGDVLVSTVRPERRTVGVVQSSLDGAICSTGFAVLRPAQIDSYVLGRLLQSDFITTQILRNNVGIAYPAIDEECLTDLLLPIDVDGLAKLTPLGKEVIGRQQEATMAEHRFSVELECVTQKWIGD